MVAGLCGRGETRRGCPGTDVGACEVGGHNVGSITGDGVGCTMLCDKFVIGLEEGAGSLLELKSGVRFKPEFSVMLLLGDGKEAKRRTIMLK